MVDARCWTSPDGVVGRSESVMLVLAVSALLWRPVSISIKVMYVCAEPLVPLAAQLFRMRISINLDLDPDKRFCGSSINQT